MSWKYQPNGLSSNGDPMDMLELGHAISQCWDLPMLQKSRLTHLPQVGRMALEERHGLELAKALRKELIACAEQITQRPRQPIEEVVSAIEKQKLNLGSQELVRTQRLIGIRLPRNKIDLARYYAIRLVMEGIDQQTIAEFLDVDLRTVANYIAQAKERIWLILESKSAVMQAV
jgi:hypothetical protein